MTRPYGNAAEQAARYAVAAEMAALHESGLSISQVGAQYGITRNAVKNRLARYGFRICAVTDRTGGAGLTVARRIAARTAALDARAMKRWGCSFEQYLKFRKMRKPTRAYAAQRENASKRSIGWEFNFSQWWSVWERSGHWSERGAGHAGYVMCRKGDVGPYAPDNVYIALGTHNTSVRPQKKSGLPTGVVQNGGRFVAKRMINGQRHCVGSFDTAEAAGAAYDTFHPDITMTRNLQLAGRSA
jgi:hypothetical protein